MYIILLILIALYPFYALIDTWLMFFTALLIYFAISEILHRKNYLHSHAARSSAFTRGVRAMFRTEFTQRSQRRLATLMSEYPDRPIVFAVAPHDPLCCAATFGFAAHGDMLPEKIAQNVYIIAHQFTRCIPFVRDILSMFGVVDASSATVDALLAAKKHIVVMPCGVYGKAQALLDYNNNLVVYRHKTRYGFIKAAVKHDAIVVPVLSPDEHNAYSMFGRQWRVWPLVVFWLVPKHKIEIAVGNPIDPRKHPNATIDELADKFYNDLQLLEPTRQRIEIREFNTE